MTKLRNATSDVGKMAQYLARKCVIHSPQAELDMSDNKEFKAKRFGKNEHYEGSKVHMLASRDPAMEPDTFVAISPRGRAMKVTVEEIDPGDFNEDQLKNVGS